MAVSLAPATTASCNWNSNMKEKLGKLITNTPTSGARMTLKGEKPKNLAKKLKLEKSPMKETTKERTPKKEPKEDEFDKMLNRYEEELRDPDKTLVVQEVAENNEGTKEDITTTGDELAYDPDVTFCNNETIGKNCSLTLSALSKVIARSPDGSGFRSLRPAALRTVMYFFTGKSISQFDHAGSLVPSLTSLNFFLITSSRTCVGLDPEAGTEMISGITMET